MITRPALRAGQRPRRRARAMAPPAAPSPPPNWDEAPETEVQAAPAPPSQEIYCLHQILTTPDAWRQVDRTLKELELAPISIEDYSDPQNRAIFAALQSATTADRLEKELDESLHPRLRIIQREQAPRFDPPSEKIASHLAYTVLLMRKEAARRTKRDLDSAWAEALADGSEELEIGAYGQQVLELEARRLEIDRALGFINSPIPNNHTRKA